jgi:YVTN family beta-propeller protein
MKQLEPVSKILLGVIARNPRTFIVRVTKRSVRWPCSVFIPSHRLRRQKTPRNDNFLYLRPVLVICSLIIIALTGCTKEDPTAPIQENPISTKGIYILNEGGFTKSNASLTLYVPDSNRVYADVFSAANGRQLGDVANDIVIYGTKAFIVVNNSHKIEVISTENHASLGTISVPGNSPNKIVIVSETKGYITNLYKGTVTAFNPSTYSIIKDNIAVGLNPQGLAVANGKVFVCNSGYGSDSTISVIDPAVDSVVATIVVARSPSDIALDSDGELIVLSNGYSNFSNPASDTPGALSVIDPKTYKVTSVISLPLNVYGHPFKLTVSNKGYGYTIGDNGVVRFDTKSNTVAALPVIARTAYSVAVDNATERIYLGDARDYNSNGMIYGYDKNGVLKDSASTGIIPGTIIFKR